MLGAVLITAAGIYLFYRAYNIGVKKEISTKDNPQVVEDDIIDKNGYCKYLSRMFNLMGLIAFATGVVSFMDGYFFKLGYYLYILYGVVIVLMIIFSIILSKGLNKFYK